MAWSVALSGLCVGLEFKPYNFEDKESGRAVSGNTVLMAISESFDAEPLRVKIRKEHHEAVQALEPYSPVEVEALLFARQRGRGEPFVEAVASVLVAVDAKTGARTDLVTGEKLEPVGAGA